MTWRDDLMEAIATKDPQKIKEVAQYARNRYEPIRPVFDYKTVEAEGRQPGEDD